MNIHGIRNNRFPSINQQNHEVNTNHNNQPGFLESLGQPVVAEHLRVADQHRVLFISGRKQVKNPYDENYCDMMAFALCPTLKCLSLTFLILLADLALFIFQVSAGLDKSSPNLLQVKYDTLIRYGGNNAKLVLAGEVYRLISAMFLHVYFLHLFGNVITTFMFLSRVQHTYGFWRTLVIYLISGISGNIFSIVVSPVGVKAGASTALFGIIGVIIGYIVINWNGLDLVGPAMKCQIWCTGLMIIVFIFIFTPSAGNQGIDYYGHLGGFLGGVWLSAIGTPIVQNFRQKVIRIVFTCILVFQLLILFLVFYLQ